MTETKKPDILSDAVAVLSWLAGTAALALLIMGAACLAWLLWEWLR